MSRADEWDPATPLRRAGAVFAAYEIGRTRASAAIVHETGLDDLPRLADTVISGMLKMLAMVAASTTLGALAGAALGALFGGVGAAPGAVAGAEIGFDAGMAVLTWLGLGAIAVAIARGLGEVTTLAHRAVVTAWNAEDQPSRRQAIDDAGQCFADAIGKLMLLILMAIVARLTASQAVSSTGSAAAATGDFIAILRRSRLGAEFAAWVEANSAKLMRNPRLRAHSEVGGSSGGGSGATTPSQLRARGEPPSPPRAGGSADSALAQQTEAAMTNAEKGVFGEAHADAFMGKSGFQKLDRSPTKVGDPPRGRGIDGVWKNPSPPPDYVITEAKFGTSSLGRLKDGTKQMSEEWIDGRLDKAVGPTEAAKIRDAVLEGKVERWVLRVDENGNVSRRVLMEGEP